jgi:2-methylcitrate dehydratase PrpD
VRDPDIVTLMKKVEMVVGEDFARHGYIPAHAPHGCRVRIRMADGVEHMRQENRGPWEPMTPPDWEALSEKYASCAAGVLGPEAISESADILRNLETATDNRRLMALTRGDAR